MSLSFGTRGDCSWLKCTKKIKWFQKTYLTYHYVSLLFVLLSSNKLCLTHKRFSYLMRMKRIIKRNCSSCCHHPHNIPWGSKISWSREKKTTAKKIIALYNLLSFHYLCLYTDILFPSLIRSPPCKMNVVEISYKTFLL